MMDGLAWWKQVGYVLRPDGLLDFVLDSAV
jgi:hypothetical protein